MQGAANVKGCFGAPMCIKRHTVGSLSKGHTEGSQTLARGRVLGQGRCPFSKNVPFDGSARFSKMFHSMDLLIFQKCSIRWICSFSKNVPLAWPGLAWLGLAWPGLACLAWLGLPHGPKFWAHGVSQLAPMGPGSKLFRGEPARGFPFAGTKSCPIFPRRTRQVPIA